jgi:hypothetical protein
MLLALIGNRPQSKLGVMIPSVEPVSGKMSSKSTVGIVVFVELAIVVVRPG